MKTLKGSKLRFAFSSRAAPRLPFTHSSQLAVEHLPRKLIPLTFTTLPRTLTQLQNRDCKTLERRPLANGDRKRPPLIEKSLPKGGPKQGATISKWEYARNRKPLAKPQPKNPDCKTLQTPDCKTAGKNPPPNNPTRKTAKPRLPTGNRTYSPNYKSPPLYTSSQPCKTISQNPAKR